MLCLGADTQLQHVAQNGNSPSVFLSQHRQRGGHRLRTSVVAVSDDGIASGLIDLLAALHAPEPSQPLPDPFHRYLQQPGNRHGGQGVGDKVTALYREANLKGLLPGCHSQFRAALSFLRHGALYIAGWILQAKVMGRRTTAPPKIP